jgi:hypothetical protein
MVRKIFVLVVMLGLLLTACTPVSPQQVAEESEDVVCQDLALFATSLNKLTEDTYESRNELEAQFSVVRMNFSNLVQSVANLKTVETGNFEEAANNLITAYSEIPEDASVQETVAQLTDGIKEVQQAAAQLSTDLKCKPGG